MQAKITDLTEEYMKVESNNNVLTYYHDDIDSPWSAVVKNARYFIVMGKREESCKEQVEFATEVSMKLRLDYIKRDTTCEDLMDEVISQRNQGETIIMATGSNVRQLGYNAIEECKKPVLFLDHDHLKLGFYENRQQANTALFEDQKYLQRCVYRCTYLLPAGCFDLSRLLHFWIHQQASGRLVFIRRSC